MGNDRKLKRLTVPADCSWWVACGNDAEQTLEHPILGDVPICDRCLQRVRDIDPTMLQAAGWRFVIHFERPNGEAGKESVFFLNPDRDTCAANVRLRFEIQHTLDKLVSIEWLESIPMDHGWGRQGPIWDSFTRVDL